MKLIAKIFDSSLGKDFWNYRIGQVISLLGDSCSNIALAWWILDKTGSAAQMSSVVAPAMIVRIFMGPLFGPLADKYSRKTLIVIADLWRFIFTAMLLAMVYFNHYDTATLIFIFVMTSMGSALFSAASSGIVPQIVAREKLQIAAQQTQAISSFAGIVGGIAGGVLVSTIGVFGAFAIDAASYLIAAYSTLRIKANTTPARASETKAGSSLINWFNELTSGFKVLFRIPVLFWICMVAMFMNLAMSPLGIILPVLTKESRNMPAWFLGALESSISLGAIVGALSIAYIQKYLKTHLVVMLGIAMIGLGTLLLPWVPNAALPLTVLFWVGIGGTWANIPLGTQISLSIPDAYRARIGSIMNFLCSGISPLGVAGAGIIISQWGLTTSLVAMGLGLVVLTPLLGIIPNYKNFLTASPEEAATFFDKHYPNAFNEEAPANLVTE
jgi:MFS family permease